MMFLSLNWNTEKNIMLHSSVRVKLSVEFGHY